MAVRIEDAGFEIRDMIAWVYGSGFPKSLDVSKAIDKAAGAEREVVGVREDFAARAPKNNFDQFSAINPSERGINSQAFSAKMGQITAPATPEAQQWQGWGTALKPALEPITVARKPLGEKTVAANVLAHGTGAINVDGGRVGAETWTRKGGEYSTPYGSSTTWNISKTPDINRTATGRWPANLIHDGSDEVVGLFPQTSSGLLARHHRVSGSGGASGFLGESMKRDSFDKDYGNDSGTAARFFYCAKCSKKDRNEGLDSSRTVKHATGLCKEENMELVVSLQKATCGSTVRWGIDESGGSITGLCPLVSLSTTLTEISKITTSQICSLLTRSLISESTADAKCEAKNGGSHAASAGSSSQSQLNTTSESQAESALGANHVVSKMLSSISDGANWIPATNFHATVKPTDLMRYLCRLVTPPGGTVLDPFMGSGSTGKAALLEGFRFIGIERDKEYMKIAEARIKAQKCD
jgi:hypothetical protein